MTDKYLSATYNTIACVTCVIPEFNQVRLRNDDAREFAITRHFPGFDIASFQEGQNWNLTVEDDLHRVLRATLIP